MVAASIAILAVVGEYYEGTGSSHTRDAVLGAIAILLIFSIPIAPMIAWSRARMRFDEDTASDAVEHALKRAIDSRDLGDLAIFNHRQVEAYQTIARSQARRSYGSSQVAAGVGLLILVIGSINVLWTSNSGARVPVTVLTGLGAAIAGYVGKTYLDTYRLTIDQMHWYYGQPLVSSYMLAAERLAEKINHEWPNEAEHAYMSILQANLTRALSERREDGGLETQTFNIRRRRSVSKEALESKPPRASAPPRDSEDSRDVITKAELTGEGSETQLTSLENR
jgi:hypothetical protein